MWERGRGSIGYGDRWGERYLNKLRVRDPIFSRLSTSKCGDLIVKWIKFNFYQNLKKKKYQTRSKQLGKQIFHWGLFISKCELLLICKAIS